MNSISPTVGLIPLKGDKAISPGQRPGCCCSRDLRPERAKAIIQLLASMLLPFQGANPNVHRPRALPWAGCLLAFQAVTPRIVYRTPINANWDFEGEERDWRNVETFQGAGNREKILYRVAYNFAPFAPLRETKF